MQWRQLGKTELKIAPLVLGGNVFGWTADKEASFAILDAFLDAGFNAIDTADFYSRFIPGHVGGESETILGEWMKDRNVRKEIVMITKGGFEMGEATGGLGKDYLPKACEASLKRLQTDYLDVYLAHVPDPKVPVEETLGAFQKLIDAGKIRYAGCSNYTPEQQAVAFAAGGNGCARYEVIQPHYNLIERNRYEGALEDLCQEYGVGVITYFALAAGFLTGKFRAENDASGTARAGVVSEFLNPRGLKFLDALDTVAARHNATPAQVSLSWIMARPSVTAPIASATSVRQLSDILKSVDLRLTPDDFAILDVDKHLSG